jgi:hypothetical protein
MNMKYNTEKHKPMMVSTEVKDQLDAVRIDMVVKDISQGGKGRVSYGDVIQHLLNENKK